MEKRIYSKFSNERAEKFSIRTDICVDELGNRIVKKYADTEEGKMHIEKLPECYQQIKTKTEKSLFTPNKCKKADNYVEFEYLEGKTLEEILDENIEKGNMEEVYHILDQYVNEIRKTYGNHLFQIGEKFREVFGNIESDELVADTWIDIDLIFPNIMISDNCWNVIDYEWTFEFLVPVNYVIYRAFFYFLTGKGSRQKALGNDLYQRFNIDETEIKKYKTMEQCFQKYTKGIKNTVNDIMQQEFCENSLFLPELLAQTRNIVNIVQVYTDEGRGFCEEDSYLEYVKINEEHKVEIEIRLSKEVKALRIDPAQYSCAIQIVKFVGEVAGKSYTISYQTNGMLLNKGEIVFATQDPMIEIVNLREGTEKVCVLYELLPLTKQFANVLVARENAAQERENAAQNRIERLERQYVLENKKVQECQQQIINKDNYIAAKEAELALIYQSRGWKLLVLFRKVKNSAKKVYFLRMCVRGCRYLKRYGFKETLKRCKQKCTNRHFQIIENNKPQIAGMVEGEIGEYYAGMPELESCKGTIAVHVHLFYEDLLGEILGYLNNIPYTFDVYISCQENVNIKKIEKRVRKVNKVSKIMIQSCPNRGRDIAPLYVQFGEEISKYDYFLHIHTKKSLYTGKEQVGWRQYSLNSVLGSEEIIRKIFWMLETKENIGLVYPDMYAGTPPLAYSWLKNAAMGKAFLEEMGIEFKDGVFMYPAGSFFWARTEALRPIFEKNLQLEDFQEEAGQADGTLAHVLERAIAVVAKSRGYQSAIVDYEEGIVRYGASFKPFRGVFQKDMGAFIEMLSCYDVISFDVFDTLITRSVFQPDDVFEVLEEQIFEMYGLDLNFLELRKEAETRAWEKKGAYTNIHDIYYEMAQMPEMDFERAEEIKKMEIETEYRMVFAREDMRRVFDVLKQQGKRIILVSDMYLTKKEIEKMLTKCGYMGYENLYISCECGYRKDQDTIWDKLFETYNKNSFIHVGDNPRSDWQTLVDRGVHVVWVPSPRDEWQLSAYYDENLCSEKTTETSLLLGYLINTGLFNSPFALSSQGNYVFKNAREMGELVFGPLFYEFMCWIDRVTEEDAVLLFLAREGYLFEQIYEAIHQTDNTKEKEHCYFLASRRAMTVAGIQKWDDVKEILGSNYYVGKISDLLQVRLGIKLKNEFADEHIFINEETQEPLEKIMKLLEREKEEIWEQFVEEKENYLTYIRETIPEEKWDKMVVVDVGYAGTIQYYLAKLLNKKIGGCYLATYGNTKPDKIGCPFLSLYNEENPFIDEIKRTGLFLEAVLQAPYGQLICFEKEGKTVKPIYRDTAQLPREILELQDGIIHFCQQQNKSQKKSEQVEKGKLNIVQKIYCESLKGKHMNETTAKIFSVEDEYCAGGLLTFDKGKDGFSCEW